MAYSFMGIGTVYYGKRDADYHSLLDSAYIVGELNVYASSHEQEGS